MPRSIRRGRAGALLAAATLAAACNASAQPRAVATDRCDPVELQAVQGGSHLLGDQQPPVPYSSVPPTSGWHASGVVEIAVHDQPLTEPQQVSVLEAGAAVVTHGPLKDGEAAALADFVRERYSGRVAVTPYDRLEPGEVVFAVWGALQRCDGMDLEALGRFVEAHAAPDPAQPGSH